MAAQSNTTRASEQLVLEAPPRPGRVAALLEKNGTLVLLLCGSACFSLLRLQSGLAQDGWMALLSGREIAQHGLPAHDTLTVWAHGQRWVDQQWLAQLLLYEMQRLGGIRLVMLFHAALATGGIAAACLLARLRASALSVTWIGALALFAYFPAAAVMRPQSFAYVLFVGVVALLILDERRPSRRIFLTLPLLVLWANLHGSELIGATLVSAYGAIGLVRQSRTAGDRSPRWLLLVVLPWAASLASPYATSLPSYYDHVLIGGHFGRYVTEWAPTTFRLTTAPLYLLVVGGGWLLGRARGRVTAFETAAFFGTALLSFQATRNLVWFGLVAIVVLPKLLDEVRTPADEPGRANRILAGAALATVVLFAAAVAAKSNAWYTRDYPSSAAGAAADAAGSRGLVFANETYADWLVWTHPDLAGRIAFDSRFELLTTRQAQSVVDFRAQIGDWRAVAAPYRVLVLSANDDRGVVESLVSSGQAHLVAKDAGVVVLRRAS